MLDRMAVGHLPDQPHVAHRDQAGNLLWEHCLTRDGFDGPYTIAYHRHRPHAWRPSTVFGGWKLPEAAPPARMSRRHYRSQALEQGGAPSASRVGLLFNEDVVVSVLSPDTSDGIWLINGDADELFFVREGGGTLITTLGAVRFERWDYVFVPRGLPYRFVVDQGPQSWLAIEATGGVSLPDQWRNQVGQLRMDAPFGHRDFRRPVPVGDEGPREILVKKNHDFHGFESEEPLGDVVGWDGTVYPWAFPILAFRPRVGQVHLPPTWHGTFALGGALVCSFVPRPVDFGRNAIPCPYPHSSMHIDEVLLYCDGAFTSREGVGSGSLSHHPAGVPHGPHPGAVERSIGTEWTDELAVMLDCAKPLERTAAAAAVEDRSYEASLVAPARHFAQAG